jgi:transcriptional regulator with XRE-family HTH domain
MPKPLPNHLPPRIRAALEAKNWGMKDLAEAISVSPSGMSELFRRGEHRSWHGFVKVCNALGVSLEKGLEILSRDETERVRDLKLLLYRAANSSFNQAIKDKKITSGLVEGYFYDHKGSKILNVYIPMLKALNLSGQEFDRSLQIDSYQKVS